MLDNLQTNMEKSLNGTEKIMDLSDGLVAYRLWTPEALDFESDYMGHCIGKGGYDKGVLYGKIEIYSIRDAHGMPCVTFDVRCDKIGQKRIVQCIGKEDKILQGNYRSAIKKFVQHQDFCFQDCCGMEELHFVKLVNHEIISFHKKRNDVYFGKDFYVKNGEKMDVVPHQVMFENIILDPQTKQIINPADLPLGECLADEISSVRNLTVYQDKGMICVQADDEDFLKIKDGQLSEVKLHHVEEIGCFAFEYCSALTKLFIPPSVERIGESAFWWCRLDMAITCATGKQVVLVQESGYRYKIKMALNCVAKQSPERSNGKIYSR